MRNKLRQIFLGRPRDAMRAETRKNIALIAFLAWIGLGADGLSSSCYGPEQAFLALGANQEHLALYLALATALTVFLISLAYNQVIKLFPNGGGGYKVATHLLGPYAGLISGAALIIDYIMTITISVASGTDAIFSLFQPTNQQYKVAVEAAILLLMVYFNLRGAKESIKILMPIFLGFFITHLLIILAGIFSHGSQLPSLLHQTINDTQRDIQSLGWIVVIGLFLRAYSLGAGTYTGIEAVSNNINILAEPRVRTGKWTMFYMALSLSVTAGGIILLYLLWHVQYIPGQTLNASVFFKILSNWPYAHVGLLILMLFEAGILLVAANTGFLGGPAVLANMSIDNWAPRRFGSLSSRLVTQNGILFFGLSALVILLWSDGQVSFLVILYSMNVFLTFSISLLGITTYWWRNRRKNHNWLWQMLFSLIAFIVCVGILITTLIEKIEIGGWITIMITSTVIISCIFIRRHYIYTNRLKKKLDRELRIPIPKKHITIHPIDPKKPTAIFLAKGVGSTLHTLLWVNRMFPGHFKNIIFISQGVVDIGSFGSENKITKLKKNTDRILDYLVKFAHHQGFAADSYATFGTDPVNDIAELAGNLNKQFPNAIYFASRYVYPTENIITRILHSDLATIMQKRLHLMGAKMLILPLNL